MPLLEWLNKSESLKAAQAAPFRLLDEVPELSYGDETSENMLIQGDNLDALKALLPLYAGKVKCIYIDPPYNTKSAFEHYDDNLEHSIWLSLMYPRLELLRELLSEDGSIWVSIDDNEAHYLKVMMDEIFQRKNFLANIVWQKRTSPDARLQLSDAHENIIVYSKECCNLAKLPASGKQLKNFKNPDNDPRGPWASTDFTAQGFRPNQMYKIIGPSGREHFPTSGTCWKNIEPVFEKLKADNRIWFGKDGNCFPRRKTFLSESEGVSVWTWWENTDVGHTQEAKKEIISIFGADNIFDTPKPERLIQRIIHIASNPGDLILDSFLGSGTTAAVAHKMNRRYIGIEIGNHCTTHCQPRLKKVIDGEQGGISPVVNWQGGGGFRFYKLGAEIFLPDGTINPDVKFRQLASFVWFAETKRPLRRVSRTPLIGIHEDTAYYLLYNGILGDRRPDGGNVLTRPVLKELPPHDGPKVIYGESTLLGAETLIKNNIVFKQIPYEVRTR